MAAPFGIPFTSWPQCFYVCHLIFRILSTSDSSVTFAFYNGLTRGNEVRFMRKNCSQRNTNTGKGVNDYLASPVNIPELIRRIRHFIKSQEQIQQTESINRK